MARAEPQDLRSAAAEIEKQARKLRTLGLQNVDGRVWIETIGTIEKALRTMADALRQLARTTGEPGGPDI